MRKLILILSLFIPALLHGQTENIVVEWDTNHDQLIFPHALYEDGDNTLPYLTRKIKWDAPGSLPVIKIKVEKTSPGSFETGSGLSRPEITDHVQSEPLLEYALVREAGQSFVTVKILPFIKTASGELERVDRFSLQIEKKMALAPLRSESTGQWSETSVLASGSWYKTIKIWDARSLLQILLDLIR